MERTLDSIAILYFAFPANVEASYKSWTKSKNQNRLIANSLYYANLNILKKSGLHVLTPKHNDIKKSFNENLTLSVKDAFENGYDTLLIVGSDTCHLSSHSLDIAKVLVADGKPCMGRTRDGGVFLFSVDKKSISPDVLYNLPWRTHSLADALNKTLYGSRAIELNIASDFDTYDDILNELETSLIFSRLLMKIQSIISSLHNDVLVLTHTHNKNFISALALRGPPNT